MDNKQYWNADHDKCLSFFGRVSFSSDSYYVTDKPGSTVPLFIDTISDFYGVLNDGVIFQKPNFTRITKVQIQVASPSFLSSYVSSNNLDLGGKTYGTALFEDNYICVNRDVLAVLASDMGTTPFAG